MSRIDVLRMRLSALRGMRAGLHREIESLRREIKVLDLAGDAEPAEASSSELPTETYPDEEPVTAARRKRSLVEGSLSSSVREVIGKLGPKFRLAEVLARTSHAVKPNLVSAAIRGMLERREIYRVSRGVYLRNKPLGIPNLELRADETTPDRRATA